jgi:glutamyl-tRNA synthetase/nondiscriminating glutamyl-tRNA synthetase
LPQKASFLFDYNAQAVITSADNAEVLRWPHTEAVISRFTFKILEHESASAGKLTAEEFKHIINQVKAESGAKGKELFHPIRVIVTGAPSGPDFDRVVPIIEEGSRLPLPKHVLSVCERVQAFGKVHSSQPQSA